MTSDEVLMTIEQFHYWFNRGKTAVHFLLWFFIKGVIWKPCLDAVRFTVLVPSGISALQTDFFFLSHRGTDFSSLRRLRNKERGGGSTDAGPDMSAADKNRGGEEREIQ